MENSKGVRNIKDSIYWWEAFFNVFKSTVGTGILTLPEAFLTAGLVSGSIGLIFVAAICIISLNLLVDANKIACQKLEVSALNYGDLVKFAFSENKYSSKFSFYGKVTTNLITFLFQFFVCSAYIRITAETINDLITIVLGTSSHIPLWALIFLMELPFGAIAVVRNMRIISIFSGFAVLLLTISLVSIFTEISIDVPSPSGLPLYTNFWMTALLMGRTIYSMESIATILPIENKMKRPEHFRLVMNSAFIAITLIYLAFALIGFMKYRFEVADVITENLPDTVFFKIIRVLFGITILFTYSIQFYAMNLVVIPLVEKYLHFKSSIFFTVLLLVTAQVFIAGIFPNVDLALSLIGGSLGAILFVVFPPIVGILVKENDKSSLTSGIALYKSFCFLILVFGCFITLTSTAAAIAEIYQSVRH